MPQKRLVAPGLAGCVDDVMSSICDSVNSELSHRIYRDISSGNPVPKYNVDAKCYPSSVDGIRAFALDYLVSSLLKKYKGLNTGKDLRAEAIASWWKSEEKCKTTNETFRHLRGLTPRVANVIFDAQRKIGDWLGFDPPLAEIFSGCTWGGGATASLKRGCGVDHKITTKISCTPSAKPWLEAVIAHDPLWFEARTGFVPSGPLAGVPEGLFEIIEYNVHDTVPKDSYTDRNIGKEPTANGFLQQGVHFFLRDVLLRVGIDLRSQKANQDLARCAAFAGLATVDLSSASDTVSNGLVRFLLPPRWYNLLDSLRSKYTRVGDQQVRLEKFSSMGNAFTFELETLIFLALSRSICKELGLAGRVSVYGDDIIIPAASKDLFLEVFAYCGFEVNESKSFWDGSFFESCGKHYFHGVDVTPVYQKELILTRESFIRFHNRLGRWSIRTSGRLRNRYVNRAMRILYENFPDRLRPRIPESSEEDTGFLSEVTSLEYKLGRGYRCRVLATRQLLLPGEPLALFALKLRIPQYSNSHPKGWDDISTKEIPGEFSFRYIHPRLSSSHEDDWLLADQV
jgi:hypothetical protein